MTSKAVQAAEAEGLQRFDPFSLMDALDDEAILRELEGMKGARNARARLVPANVKAEIIARAKQTKRARVVDAPVPDRPAPAAPAPAGPPPAAPAKPADPADSTWKGRRLGDYATEELLAMQREMAAARKPEKFTRVLDAIETVLAGRQGA